MFNRFSDQAKKLIALAQSEATRLRHENIAPEHLLHALLGVGRGVALSVLENLYVGAAPLRFALESRMVAGRHGGKAPRPFTEGAKQVIVIAAEKATELGHAYIGTEHLLLGMLLVPNNLAHHVLLDSGLSVESVREQIIALTETGTEDLGSA